MWDASDSGTGVWGSSFTGRAVVAASTHDVGLDVSSGRARLGQISDVATIARGTRSKTVSPGVDIVEAAFVLLTPRGDIGSRSLWYTTSPAADTLTIHLGSALLRKLRVAWLLLG